MRNKLPLDGLRDIFLKALNEIPDEEIAKDLPCYISKKQLLAEAW